VHAFIVLVLTLGGALGTWVGLVEGNKLAFLAGLITWGAASIGVFRGNFNSPARTSKGTHAGVGTAMSSSVVMGLLVFGAGAAWVGFVEDIKIGMLIAIIAWVAATFLAFRGDGQALANAVKGVDRGGQ
jgi:hypothetical protein